jgi:signal transduction histidine kinase
MSVPTEESAHVRRKAHRGSGPLLHLEPEPAVRGLVDGEPGGSTEAQVELRRMELGIAADRERIALDLHDGVIQRIFATAMSVQSLRARLPPSFDAEAARIVDELDRTIAEIRTVIFRLLPQEGIKCDLQSDLLRVVDDMSAALGFVPTVHISGDLPSRADWSHHVCAILRELLSNIARHAQASMAEVELRAGEQVVLRVRDDGIGFDPAISRHGRGVPNVTQRAAVLGGSLLIHPGPGGGTTIECIVPLPKETTA